MNEAAGFLRQGVGYDIPERAEIDAQTGQFSEDGWEDDFAVVEDVPPVPVELDETDGEARSWPPNLEDLATTASLIWEDLDTDWRKPGLRVVPDSVRMHRVLRVVFETKEFPVRRHRQEKREPDFQAIPGSGWRDPISDLRPEPTFERNLYRVEIY